MIRPILLILVLAGASQAAAGEAKWVLPDGRSARSDPTLWQRALADLAICNGERAKLVATGTALNPYARQEAADLVFDGCMYAHGYVKGR